jgi:hypothetical protein
MEALQSLGQFLQGPGGQSLLKVGEVGMTGAGLVGNILNERARSQELNKLKTAEATLADPTKLSSEVRAATQPLNAGLVQDVSNQVSGNLAERGLAQAPGIQATELSTALAPFEQANQQTALQLVLTRLGLPIEYAKTILAGLPQNTNLSPLLALLQRNNNPSGGSTGSDFTGPADFMNVLFPGGTGGTPPIVGDTGDFQLPADIFA